MLLATYKRALIYDRLKISDVDNFLCKEEPLGAMMSIGKKGLYQCIISRVFISLSTFLCVCSIKSHLLILKALHQFFLFFCLFFQQNVIIVIPVSAI